MTPNRVFALFGFTGFVLGVIMVLGSLFFKINFFVGFGIAVLGGLIAFVCYNGEGDVARAAGQIDFSPLIEKVNEGIKAVTIPGVAMGVFFITLVMGVTLFCLYGATGSQIAWFFGILAVSVLLWVPEKVGKVGIWLLEKGFELAGQLFSAAGKAIVESIEKGKPKGMFILFILLLVAAFVLTSLKEGTGGQKYEILATGAFIIAIVIATCTILAFISGLIQGPKEK